MNRRRSEALRQLTRQREQLEREVERTRATTAAAVRSQLDQARNAARLELERARAAAEEITAAAQRRVQELVALRERLVEQLGGARSALDDSLSAAATATRRGPRRAGPGRPSHAEQQPGRGPGPGTSGTPGAAQHRPTPAGPAHHRRDAAPGPPALAHPGPRTGPSGPPDPRRGGAPGHRVPLSGRRPGPGRRTLLDAPRYRRPPGRRRCRADQQDACQCRRSSTEPYPVAGHTTRCGMPVGISWSQPGQR